MSRHPHFAWSLTAPLVSAILLCTASAHAQLSYTFVEGFGAPLATNKRASLQTDDPVRLRGTAYGGALSFAVHKNFHFLLRAIHLDQTDQNYFNLARIGVPSELDINQTTTSASANFNYRVHPKVDTFFGLGVQWGGSRYTTEVEGEQETTEEDEYGLLARMGARAMVWRELELAAAMEGSNIAVIENNIVFDVQLRYHFLSNVLDVGLGGRFGTNTLAQLNLSARFYFAELFYTLRRKRRGS